MSISLLGNITVYFALISSAAGIVFFYLGHLNQNKQWIAFGRGFVYANFYAMTVASLAMAYALLSNDFSVSYVAHVGAKETPRFYAMISLWSSLEGSILLWGWILSAYSAWCLYRYRDKHFDTMPWVGITLLLIGFFFYLVLAVPANPFGFVHPVPENGPGPNPLLQNHWLMGVHPPCLYLGYVGMSIPFAFAVASMATGRFDNEWVKIIRRWHLVAWGFLTIAILLGGWWSYAVLGWGGYWAWDPVENASFMPWLTATAFLHSIMVQEERNMLKIWNLGLVTTTFLLTLLGTFLTRSGVIESVHSFTQSAIGHYFLAAILIALAVSVALLIWHTPKLQTQGKLDHPFCRETAFLFNNLLFTSFCFVVLLGTLYPILSEAVRGVKVTVGAPFFDQMTVPIALAIILLMGVGAALPWKRSDAKTVLKLTRKPFLSALLVGGAAFLLGVKKPVVLLTILFAALSLGIMLFEMLPPLWKGNNIFTKNPRRYGGFVVHIGIIIIAIGIAVSGGYKKENQVTLQQGESMPIGIYTLRFAKLSGEEKPQRFEIKALMDVFKGNRYAALLTPQLNYYRQSREPIGTPSVLSTVTRDLYLTLMAFDHKERTVTIRAIVTPAVSWIWGGGGVILFGVLIALGFYRRET